MLSSACSCFVSCSPPQRHAYLGELAKWVPVAVARTLSLEYTEETTRVTVRGEPSEVVELAFAVASGDSNDFSVIVVPCTISAAGTATATLSASASNCV